LTSADDQPMLQLLHKSAQDRHVCFALSPIGRRPVQTCVTGRPDHHQGCNLQAQPKPCPLL
jgi:hypothetical protein